MIQKTKIEKRKRKEERGKRREERGERREEMNYINTKVIKYQLSNRYGNGQGQGYAHGSLREVNIIYTRSKEGGGYGNGEGYNFGNGCGLAYLYSSKYGEDIGRCPYKYGNGYSFGHENREIILKLRYSYNLLLSN